MDKIKPYWVNATTVMKLTGWSRMQLMKQRELNPSIYKDSGTGGYIYNINIIPKELFKGETAKQSKVLV